MLLLLKNNHTQQCLIDRFKALCDQEIKYQKADYLGHIENMNDIAGERCKK